MPYLDTYLGYYTDTYGQVTVKQSGLGDNFYIGGYDLSGDIASLDQVSTTMAPLNTTAINKLANERIPGRRDASLQFTSYFNKAAGQEHAILSTLPKADTIASYFRGTTLLNPTFCINGKEINYDPTRDASGNLTFKVEVQANSYAGEWGVQLTPGLRTDTSATVGSFTSDTGAASTNGAQAYLQLVAFTGTSVDVTITHATTSGGSYSTVIDFGAQTAVGAFRGTAAGTVNQFLKVVTAGTFTNAVFAVSWIRNQGVVQF